MTRFPDDLRKLVLKLPTPDAMVILPLPTIQKMLPTGSVKMSLASVVRQSPPGTFATINPQDKRMVEVPLAEIFKRISPALLKKRSDQKLNELAADGFDIFGDDENPRTLAPRVEGTAAASGAAPRVVQARKVLKVAPGLVTVPPLTAAAPITAKAPEEAPATLPKPKPLVVAEPAATPTTRKGGKKQAAVEKSPKPQPAAAEPEHAPTDEQPRLVISLKDLIGAWPEPIKSEAAALNGATLSLPGADIAAGLAKGKVAFAWGQLRGWITPPPSEQSQGGEDTEIVLPLRVLAPAFLKHTKGATTARKAAEVGDIPELFAGGRAAPAKPEAKAGEPEPVPAAAEPSAVVVDAPKTDEPVVAKTETPAEPPAAAEAVVAEVEPSAAPEAPVEAPVDEVVVDAPKPVEVAPEPVVAAPPKTIGEFLGDPQKTSWSPTEVVNLLCEIEGVTGAIVALQEGLVIAHKLPEPFKGETFAAFLPQIFARLNNYAGEMKLGAVNELTIQTESGPCHIFRRGQVLFAALGKPDSSVPLTSLRLCADAVAS
ncbi:MAG: roadblock/LC7 domain-containing protein [Chthoniobacteraceae bacterium]